MFQTIRNAFKIPELRKKLFFTLFVLLVFRFGCFLPVPWIDTAVLAEVFRSDSTFGIMNIISGGTFEQAGVFAMGVSPYINASIIMQLLTVAIPALEKLAQMGEEGRKKIASITRYVTVALGLIQAFGYYMILCRYNAISAADQTFFHAIVIITAYIAGTTLVMWLGEQVNTHGIGNGVSMIIMAGIIARLPYAVRMMVSNFKWYSILVVAFALAMVVFIVLFNDAERRIPVMYKKRVVGRKMYGGQSTHIPLKVTMAGVIPIIFAMSILSFPTTLIQMFNANPTGFWARINSLFSQTSWFYAILYLLLIFAFSFFYTSITFNPIEIANNLKTQGGVIPGIREGEPTSQYIQKKTNRVTFIGAVFISIVAAVPVMIGCIFNNFAGLGLGGSSVMIVVGVALETVRQIESQLVMRHYKGFLG